MSDQKEKVVKPPEELIQAKQLINEGKFDDALLIKKNFEEKGDCTLYDVISCQLLKCAILYQQSLYEDAFNLAEEAYKKSLEFS